MGTLREARRRGRGPRPRDNSVRTGPLRAIVSVEYRGDVPYETLSCGHVQRAKHDLAGPTNAIRRRCRKCKKVDPAVPSVPEARTTAPGIFQKYDVRRTDGSSGPGGRHEHCAYFVLDLEHDEHAIPALRAYARSCAKSRPELARDLTAIVRAHEDIPRCGCREVGCPHSLGQALHVGPSDRALELMRTSEQKAPR